MAVPHGRGVAADVVFHKVGGRLKQWTVGHQHVGHAACPQAAQLVRQAQPRSWIGRQRAEGRLLGEACFHRLPNAGQERPGVLQPMGREGDRDACVVQSGRVGRGEFPMLQFVEADHAGQVGIRHVVTRGEIHGDRHAVAGLGNGLGALVAVAAAQHDGVLHAKLREHHVCPQHIFPAACRKHPRQRAAANERVQRQVGSAGHATWGRLGVPCGVEVGLAQQGGRAHQRTGVVLRRRPFAEAHVERCVWGEKGLAGIFQGQNHRACAADNPVLHMGQHRAKSRLAQRLGRVGRGVEHRRRRRLRPNRFVPAVRAFLVAEVLGGAGPACALGFWGAEVAVDVHKRGVQVKSCHVEAHRRTVKRGRGGRARCDNASAVQDDRAVFHNGGGVEVHGGVFQHRGDERLVLGAVDREGGVGGLGLKARGTNHGGQRPSCTRPSEAK